MKSAPVLTIDGPSGAGKGTVSSRVAAVLKWHFLDSGALYRLTALAAIQHQVDLENSSALAALAENLDVSFMPGGEVLLEGVDVHQDIRAEEVGLAASTVASIPEVREALLNRQKAFAEAPGLVADGRDMGTTVFPDAAAKVFLTASSEERARRRYEQLRLAGQEPNYEKILADVISRDEKDRTRSVSPMVAADDALIIDSTHQTIEQVVETTLQWLREKGLYA